MAQLPCEECHTHVYQIPSGLPDTYEGEGGAQVLMKRPPGASPPCDLCPKGISTGDSVSPDWENRYILNWANIQLVELYKRLRSPGYDLPGHLKNDGLFADRYADVDAIFREVERDKSNEFLAVELARLILRST